MFQMVSEVQKHLKYQDMSVNKKKSVTATSQCFSETSYTGSRHSEQLSSFLKTKALHANSQA